MAICACDLGMGMGLFASLKLTHLIPPDRLTEDYLVRLVEGLAYSSLVLNSFRPTLSANGHSSKKRLSSQAADVARLLTRNRRERRFFRAVKRGEARAAKMLKEQS